jgi:single-stranded-DNA-specific exonuclease
LDVIITDHHTPLDILPEAKAIINPKVGSSYPFKELA